MSGEDGAHSRLCPEHRNNRIPTSSCVACAQARRIDELEQTVERLSARVGTLESHSHENDGKAEEGTRIAMESK